MNRVIVVNGELAYECIGHENYFITKSGHLYSIFIVGGQGRTDITKPREVKSKFTNDGYLEVLLSNNKKKTCIRLHRLVATQFIGPIEEGMVINHKDGNKLNNDVSNLEIVTIRENVIHAIKTGLIVKHTIVITVYLDGKEYKFESYESCLDYFGKETLPSTYLFAVKANKILPHYLYLKWNNYFYGDFSISAFWNRELFRTFDSPFSMDHMFGSRYGYTLKRMSDPYDMQRRFNINRLKLVF